MEKVTHNEVLDNYAYWGIDNYFFFVAQVEWFFFSWAGVSYKIQIWFRF